LAEKISKKYQLKMDKEFESYRNELEVMRNRQQDVNEHVKYVSKLQFETEFNAYQAIFDNLFKFSVLTRELYPVVEWYVGSKDEQNETYKKRINEFRPAYNEFSKMIEVNAPFIPKDIYEMFVNIRKLAMEISNGYLDIRTIDNDKSYFDSEKLAKEKYPKEDEFNKLVQDSKDKVRDYLSTLRIFK
jgi:hypothetical protein